MKRLTLNLLGIIASTACVLVSACTPTPPPPAAAPAPVHNDGKESPHQARVMNPGPRNSN